MNKDVFLRLAAITTIMVFSDCRKNKECGKTQADVAGTYNVTSYSIGNEPYNERLSICEKDMDIVLNKEGTVAVTSSTGCPGSSSGTWGITSDGKFFLNSGGYIGMHVANATIVSYDCSVLKVDDPERPGEPRRRFTYNKKQ
jgi:hypothetical protein